MLKINGEAAVAAYYREHHGMFVIHHTRDSLEIDDGDEELRPVMSDLNRAWRKNVTAHASDLIPFRGPHCGVHVRRWRNVHEPSGWSPILSIDDLEYTIEELESMNIRGLGNDAIYWDMRRTYGDDSEEVRLHLKNCAIYQGLIRRER